MRRSSPRDDSPPITGPQGAHSHELKHQPNVEISEDFSKPSGSCTTARVRSRSRLAGRRSSDVACTSDATPDRGESDRAWQRLECRIGPADHGREMTLAGVPRRPRRSQATATNWAGGARSDRSPLTPTGRSSTTSMKPSADIAASIAGSILRIGHGSECRLCIPETVSGRNPDLAIVFHGTPEDARGRRPPGLAVEVVSPGARPTSAITRPSARSTWPSGSANIGSSIPIDGRSPCWSARTGRGGRLGRACVPRR